MLKLKFRRLGNSGLKVSEISLGSWLTYGGYVEDDNSIRIIDKAYDLGINYFDTANVYHIGEAEKVVGKALKQFPRDSYVLSTKVFFPMGEGINQHGLSRKHIIEQANSSLKRLEHDYVDIYYAHRYDADTPLEETLRAFDDLIRQGKTLYVGVSQWTPAQIAEAVHIADKKLLDRIVVNQPVYNMFDRYIEKEIIPLCDKHGIGQVVYSPLAQGMLTGKYKKGQLAPQGSRAADADGKKMISRYMEERHFQKIEALERLAEKIDVKLSQLAIAWTLKEKNVCSALIGASNPSQLEENIKAIEIELTEEILKEIEDILKVNK